MDRKKHKEKLIRFLHTIQKSERILNANDEDQALISSGFIDSLSVMEIVCYLEEEYGIDFTKRGMDHDALDSIAKILNLIEHKAQ